jgi:hypothetical protein
MTVEIVTKDEHKKSELNLAHFKENCHRYHDVVCDFKGEAPEIVVLCGSTRFYDLYQSAYYKLTMTGYIVLSVGFYPHAVGKSGHGEGVGHSSEAKEALDELHKRKIDLADHVIIITDSTGYTGDSTRSEIAYAEKHNKPVHYSTDVE